LGLKGGLPRLSILGIRLYQALASIPTLLNRHFVLLVNLAILETEFSKLLMSTINRSSLQITDEPCFSFSSMQVLCVCIQQSTGYLTHKGGEHGYFVYLLAYMS